LILDILCSCRWQSHCSLIPVWVGFLYMVNLISFSLSFIETLRKLMKLCNSFSIVTFIVGYCLLNSANLSSMFVSSGHRLKECHLHIERIWLFGILLILGIAVCVPCFGYTQCVQVLLGLCSLKIQDVNYFQNFTLLIQNSLLLNQYIAGIKWKVI
jgi:hypothetical protein